MEVQLTEEREIERGAVNSSGEGQTKAGSTTDPEGDVKSGQDSGGQGEH